MTDDTLVNTLLQRVGRDYLDALTAEEVAAHIAAGTDEGDDHRLDDIAGEHGMPLSHTTTTTED